MQTPKTTAIRKKNPTEITIYKYLYIKPQAQTQAHTHALNKQNKKPREVNLFDHLVTFFHSRLVVLDKVPQLCLLVF